MSAVTNQTVWVRLGWLNASGIPQERVVPVGPMSATTLIWRAWVQLKEIALPLVLAGLGFWFQTWEGRRARRLTAEERHRTELAETWQKMLPISHDYAIKYYMPVVHAAELAESFSLKVVEDSIETQRRALWAWVVFWKRVREQIDGLHGFYFKDRSGEEMASVLLEQCFHRYYERPDSLRLRKALNDLMDKAGKEARFEEFSSRWNKEKTSRSRLGKEVNEEFDSFRAWITSDPAKLTVQTLRTLTGIMRLEMNRVYQPWYGKAERMRMNSEEARIAWAAVDAAAANGAISKEELGAYLVKNGCPPVEPAP